MARFDSLPADMSSGLLVHGTLGCKGKQKNLYPRSNMKGAIKWCAMCVPDACLITLSLHVCNFSDVNMQCVHLFNFSLSPQIPNCVEYMKC